MTRLRLALPLIAWLAVGCAVAPLDHPIPSLAPDDTGQMGRVRAADGVELVYRAWIKAEAPGRPMLVVIPGIGYHGAPYRVVADFLAGWGYDVVAVDLRGHGRSGGPRAVVPTPGEIVSDLDAVTDRLRRDYAPARLHLVGESLGGLVAFHYAAAAGRRLDSLVLVAPALSVAPAQLLHADTVAILLAALCCRDAPVVDLAARLDEATRDPGFRDARRRDPLAVNRLSVRYLLGVRALMADWPRKAAAVTAPTLILHGQADRVLSWTGSHALHQALGAPRKRLVLFETARHTLFWDPDSPAVFAEIRRWLAEARGSRRGGGSL